MTILCARCQAVMSRYAPVEDRETALCRICATQIADAARHDGDPLHCGRGDCALEIIPYACLVAEARADPIEACPAIV